ncbi:kinase-like domain-containing protein [Xylariaceae sp. FL1651]|nr:kinase-like domain-containing protein [Xylariaceae sp. FL1651]
MEDTEDIRKFLRNHEARPQNRHYLAPGHPRPGLRTEGSASSQHESDTETRVLDYGDRAWTRSSARSNPSPDPEDLLGLAGTAIQTTMPSTEEFSLKDNLEIAMVTAYPDDKQAFLPLGQLSAICHRNAVRHELVLTFGEDWPDIDRFTNYVCGSPDLSRGAENTSRKIFAILVLIGQVRRIEPFAKEGIKDRHLPFRKSPSDSTTDDYILLRRTTLDKYNPKPMTCFDTWSQVEKRKFYQEQWSLLSPYFARASDGSVALYELDEQAIIPRTSIGVEKQGSFAPLENLGGYSKVTQVVLHPDHHAFEARKFAIKELFDADETPFVNEFRNLKKVETRKHLLPVFTAYRQGGRYSFIFPWADGGSLTDLWKTEPQLLKEKVLVTDQDDNDAYRSKIVILWIASQLSGLTGKFGLGFLHDTKFLEAPQPTLAVPEREKRYGIHGDLKPGNILYFTQGHDQDGWGLGLFKISDFGITGFHSALTRSRQPPTGPHSPTYRAPEYGMLEAYLSRKYDIWGLGCVLLQFLTWFISGPEALEQFNQVRFAEEDEVNPQFAEDKFFCITQPEDPSGSRTFKHSVQFQINKLQGIVKRGNYLHDCLELIKSRMLQLDDSKRADCKEVHELLEKYHQRCHRESEYLTVDLPTFNEAKVQRAQHPSLQIHITDTSSKASNQSQELRIPTAQAGSKISVSDEAIIEEEEAPTRRDSVSPAQARPVAQQEVSTTQEYDRRRQHRRIFSCCGFSFQIPQRKRYPT